MPKCHQCCGLSRLEKEFWPTGQARRAWHHHTRPLPLPQTGGKAVSMVLMLIGGSALLAAGIALQVMTDLLCLPGDAIVKIVSEKLRWNFGKLKISFDVTLTTTAIVISLVSLSALRGVREGTVTACSASVERSWRSSCRACALQESSAT